MDKSIENDKKIPDSIDDEKLKEIILETSHHQYKEFISAFSKMKINKNRKTLEKYAKKFREEISKVKNKGYRSGGHDNAIIMHAIREFMHGVLSVKGTNNKYKIYIQENEYMNASISYSLSKYFFNKDKSKRKTTVNICVTTGFIKLLEPDEMIAVLLHEAGHFFYVHKYVYMHEKFLKFIQMILVLTFSIVFIKHNISSSRNRLTTSNNLDKIILLVITIVYYIIDYRNYIGSKRMEQISDAYASYMGYGKELASAFDKSLKFANNNKKFKPISTSKLKIIITNILLYYFHDPHESPDIRICKSLSIAMMDNEIKRNKDIYNKIKIQYDYWKCHTTIKNIKDLKL